MSTKTGRRARVERFNANQGQSSSVSEDRRSDHGFTLIELLIVVTIIPIIVGAISVALVSTFSLQSTVSGRLSDTSAAQVTSSVYVKDVQSAAQVTTHASSPACGSGGSLLLALRWSGGLTGFFQTTVSYANVPITIGGVTTYNLVRKYCTNGNTTTPALTTIISHDLTPAQASPCLQLGSSSSCGVTDTGGWISAAGVALVKFVIYQPKSSYTYTLSATPRAWTPASGGGPSGGQPSAPVTLLGGNCASPGGTLSIGNNGSLTITVGATPSGVTSTTSTSIGTGSKTFAISSQGPFTVGQSVHVAYATITTDYMEGTITALTSSSMTVNVSLVAGSGGPYSSWTFTALGSGVLAVGATCANSVQVNNGATLDASTVLTSNPSLTSLTGGGSYPSNEVYAGPLTDPLAGPLTGLVPPTTNSSAPTGSCVLNGVTNIWNCSPGNYAADPSLTFGGPHSTVNFQAGNYWFAQGLNLPNTDNVNFNAGVYVFDGSGTVLSTGTSGDVITGTNVLFYAPNGNINFGNNETINLTALSAYYGVAIWDAAVGGTVTLANNGALGYSYGGIYVPNGTVIDSNNGTIGATFIIANSAQFSNNVVVNITAP